MIATKDHPAWSLFPDGGQVYRVEFSDQYLQLKGAEALRLDATDDTSTGASLENALPVPAVGEPEPDGSNIRYYGWEFHPKEGTPTVLHRAPGTIYNIDMTLGRDKDCENGITCPYWE